MRYRNWSTIAALLALVMWNMPQVTLAHGGGHGGGGGGGFGGGHGGGFGGGHGGFGGGHMGGFSGGHHGGFGGFSGGHHGGYSGLGGAGLGAGSFHSGGIGHSGIGHSGIGHSGIGHSGVGHTGIGHSGLGGSTLGGAGGLSGVGGHHAAGTVMHNPNSFTTQHLGGHHLTNGATGNHVISGYRGTGNNFAGTHAQGLLSHRATGAGQHSAFLHHHHVPNAHLAGTTGGLGGRNLASTGTMGHHHQGMGGNNYGHHGHHHHNNNNFFFPFFGFGFPFFGYGLGYGYGFGYPYYGYGYGYPYYYGYNPYAYYYGPSYGYGAYANSYPQADPTQQVAAGSDAEVFAQKGENDFKRGDYKSAVYAWRHAVLDDPQNGVLMLMLAQGLFAMGSFDEAAGAVQQGLQLLPEDQWGVVVSNYKELYGKTGDYKVQLPVLEKAVKAQPDDPGLRFLLGYHYGFLGYPQHAVKQLNKALELAPADQFAEKLRDQFDAKVQKPADANGKAPDDKEAGGGQPKIENKVTAVD